MLGPIGIGESIRKRGGGGYVAQSESKASSELQKYMSNSLIWNIQIAETYLFDPHAIYLLMIWQRKKQVCSCRES